VYVLATHGIFSGTCSLILQEAGNLEKIVVTNSLPQSANVARMGSKIEVIDISGMVSEFIRRSHYNESVSVLSGRYFKLTDKEAEHRERKISDVGVLFSIHLIQILQSHLDFKRIILSWSR